MESSPSTGNSFWSTVSGGTRTSVIGSGADNSTCGNLNNEDESLMMNDVTVSTVRTGALRAPGDLGVPEVSTNDDTVAATNTTENNQVENDQHQQQGEPMMSKNFLNAETPTTTYLHPEIVRRRQRQAFVVQQSRRNLLQQNSATYSTGIRNQSNDDLNNHSSAAAAATVTLCYRGFQVLFVISNNSNVLLVLCPRTHYVLQRISLSSMSKTTTGDEESNDAQDMTYQHQLHAHSVSGQVALVTTANNNTSSIRTFLPQPADPWKHNFGPYQWYAGPGLNDVHLADWCCVGGHDNNHERDSTGNRISVCLSYTYKLLCAIHNQVVLLDVSSNNESDDDNKAECLWTTMLPGPVRLAQLSGDGHSVALVLVAADDGETHNEATTNNDYDSSDGHHNDDPNRNIISTVPSGGDSCAGSVGGVYTFVRDFDDGAGGVAMTKGMIYRPGPFLMHAAPVTRLVFRGLGHVTSSSGSSTSAAGNHKNDNSSNTTVGSHHAVGNDLLLTMDEDCSVHIFGQRDFKCITTWTCPPHTQVDWVRGLAKWTLGDLEEYNTSGSSKNTNNNETTAVAQQHQQNYHYHHHHHHHHSSAGAWIMELTFQGPFPALRLSRLSYFLRNNTNSSNNNNNASATCNATLWESVSAFLPQCLNNNNNAINDQCLWNVEAVWPAWNSTQTGGDATVGVGGGRVTSTEDAATMRPPTELRLVAPSSSCGHCSYDVVILEIPLHGPELGPVLQRSLLRLNDYCKRNHCSDKDTNRNNNSNNLVASRQVESNCLVARCAVNQTSSAATTANAATIGLEWRRPGSMSLVPHKWTPSKDDMDHGELLQQTTKWRDESIVPVPLALPSLHVKMSNEDRVGMLTWWPYHHVHNNGSAPILLALLTSGTIVAVEIPPAWSSCELPVPGRLLEEAAADDDGYYHRDSGQDAPNVASNHSSERGGNPDEYEVSIVPDPEHGLGLRLECQADGMPAIAGSFKRHPLTGDVLSTERLGMVTLGDELLSADGIDLTNNKSFDEIIRTVREVQSTPGHAVRMKFRRKPRESINYSNHHGTNSSLAGLSSGGNTTAGSSSSTSSAAARRDVMGVSTTTKNQQQSRSPPKPSREQTTSDASALKESSSSSWDGVCGRFANVLDSSVLDGSGRGETSDIDSRIIVSTLPSAPVLGNDVAMLSWITKTELHVVALYLADWDPSKSQVIPLAVVNVSSAILTTVTVVEQMGSTVSLLVMDEDSQAHLVVVAVENSTATLSSWTAKSETYPLFQSIGDETVTNNSMVVRSCSIELVAIMQKENPTKIHVWSARPHPGCSLSCDEKDVEDEDSRNTSDYYSMKLELDSNGCFVDFFFSHSGFLDADPALICFTQESVTIFRRHGGEREWLPATTVFYKNQPPLHLSAVDAFPHLLPSLQSTYSSMDERSFIRSDWHPDSLISQLCLDKRGIKSSLRQRLRYLYIWICSEGQGVSDDDLEGSLMVAPLPIIEEDEADCGPVAGKHGNPNSVMSALNGSAALFSANDNANASYVDEEEAVLLREMQALLSSCITGNPQSPVGAIGRVELPAVLRSMDKNDLEVVWAVGDMLLDPPPFDTTDTMGQLFLFTRELVDRLTDMNAKKKPYEKKKMVMPSMHMVVSPSSRALVEEEQVVLASAGCLAMLMSDSQSKVLDICRQGQKFDWDMARRLRIAFWLRSDTQLAKISEEIGQSLFREKRDIMECALFFIIAGKIRTLRNLAATDATDSGKKFFKFITGHDFSSERGRRAAEKNAFSLLRKNRYMVASAFFLLAQPPFLKSALETLVTKLKDTDLAFLVARLMESSTVQRDSVQSGIGAVLGGGGGYAGSGISVETHVEEEGMFKGWTPRLGPHTKSLIVDRILPQSGADNILCAVQLLWMDKREESSWWLSGFVEAHFGFEASYEIVDDIGHRLYGDWRDRQGSHRGLNRSRSSTGRSNSLIDFASAPSLLSRLGVSPRSLRASCLAVSRALTSRGMELSSIRSLVGFQEMKTHTEKEDGKTEETPQHDASSSIFDSFDPPKPSGSAKKESAPSIFDSFDARAQPAPQAPSIFDSYEAPPATNPTASSIFDSFSGPPPAAGNPASSSIFDSYDTPVAAKPAAPSIFESFDPPPAAKKQASIFDSSDAAPQPAASPGVSNGSPQQKQEIATKEAEISLHIKSVESPVLWTEWRRKLLIVAAGRRLLREIGSVVNQFQGDPASHSISSFYHSHNSLIPARASEVLQVGCDAEQVVGRVLQSLSELCTASCLDAREIIDCAHDILGHSLQFHRTLFSVILFAAWKRDDLADSAIRCASSDLIGKCAHLGLSLDNTFHQRQNRCHVASQHLRRMAARVSWQLEICLWLQRGGGVVLSPATVKEAVIAVRLGLLVASWNQTHECLESMLRSEPDIALDDDSGRVLWSSLHASVVAPNKEECGAKSSSSGGWEFLVDCRRSEATRLLRDMSTGCFIIRPHPNDHGVFTLSFKTNLLSKKNQELPDVPTSGNVAEQTDETASAMNGTPKPEKTVKKDDVVQHAVIRLSDSGFRCGSFGPFASLISLLEAVSESLPFNLRFDLPPTNRVIKEEGSQPSPNAVFFRKLALSHADSLASSPPTSANSGHFIALKQAIADGNLPQDADFETPEKLKSFGAFLDLLVLHKLRRQICAIALAQSNLEKANVAENEEEVSSKQETSAAIFGDDYVTASRGLRPLHHWVQSAEALAAPILSPNLESLQLRKTVDFEELTDAIEIETREGTTASADRGDKLLRKMIQRGSGVEFSTLRLLDGGECTMVVVFAKAEAIQWLITSGSEQTEADATHRMERMEKTRVVESIDISQLPLKQKMDPAEDGARYRIVDPWEVEALLTRDGETRSAALGRERLLSFSMGQVALAPEQTLRMMGGLPMLELWTAGKGGIVLTKALAAVYAPWERAAGGDLIADGDTAETHPYANSIRQHLYRNMLYRQLQLPQRFVALVQVELLDLKNLTSPGGSLSLYVYSLARLKREGSGSALSNKSRTLDTAATQAVRLGKSTGPNAPASWGSVVRFRFPLPEDVCVEGSSYDSDREALFKGPPNILQVTVYEKKLLVDHSLGSADIRMDGLWGGGQLEEWVPLRSEKQGDTITWFARIRLTLRFELMCLSQNEGSTVDDIPSVGLQKIAALSHAGGSAHEDNKRSMSSPDLLSYFENIMY